MKGYDPPGRIPFSLSLAHSARHITSRSSATTHTTTFYDDSLVFSPKSYDRTVVADYDAILEINTTLKKVEEGDAHVSIGIYCSILTVLGMVDGIGMLADPLSDEVGMAQDEARLPQRARGKRHD